MTRVVVPPSLSTVTVANFYGTASDRSGVKLDKREFTLLQNIVNKNLKTLAVRPGGIKSFSQTHTTGTDVRALHTFVDDAGTELYVKMSGGKVYKSSGSTWSEITASAPGGGFTEADTWMVTLNTKDTGSSNSTSGTTTSAEATSIEDDGIGWTPGAYTKQVLTINSEIKNIGGNDADIIYLNEAFDTLPTADAFTVNPRAQEFFIATGTEFYKCDGTTFTQLDTSNFAKAFDGIEVHHNRIFAWKGTSLFYSDNGVGEHFSRNAVYDFATPIQRVYSFGSVLVIFERRRVTVMFGDNPDRHQFVEVLNEVGTTAPKSVTSYGDYIFFVSEEYGFCVLSLAALANRGKVNEPLSISEDFINDNILAQSSANLRTTCAGTHKGEVHWCCDNDWYRLNVKASLDTPRDPFGNVRWIWSLDDRPDAMDALVLGHYGTKFVAGAQDSGQVYEIEESSTYDDDGTAISYVIEKQNWQKGEYGKRPNHYHSLHIRQENNAASSLVQSYFFAPGGNSYGTAVETVDLNSALSADHEIQVTGNPSDDPPKNSGEFLSYKITGSSSIAVPEFELINLGYFGGIVK
jgi:hypothetical protein